ncbi:MAG: extracellular solute-binding protein [Ruminococcus sp.]|nr:extracellular solute-binding protein [Ruminococcus sp.]
MTIKRLSAFLAAILMVSSAAVSCGEGAGGGQPDPASAQAQNTQDTAETEPETTAASGLAAEITPELKKELGLEGYNVTVYNRDSGWAASDIYSEEQDGEALNDAVFARNRYLEETYGFTVSQVIGDGSLSDLGSLVLAGDSSYDLAFPMARTAAGFATSGYLTDLSKLKYIDFESGVWNSMFNDTLAILSRRYYASGDISVNLFKAVRAFMFNKGLAAQYQLEDLYQLVRDGKWTLERFDAICRTVSADLDGDSAMTNKDQWGIAWQSTISGIIFYYGAGQILTPLDENGDPYLDFGSEKSIQVFDRIQAMMSDKNVYLTGETNDVLSIFHDGRSLFYTEVMDALSRLRDSDTDIGVLPLTKWDDAQQDYVQFADGWCISPVVIPVSAKSPELSGFAAQAIAEASSVYVRPVYYDICLTGKYIRDEESAEMLDIIFGNCVLDNCDIYEWAGLWQGIVDAFSSKNGAAALAAKYQSKVESAMEKTMTAISELQ